MKSRTKQKYKDLTLSEAIPCFLQYLEIAGRRAITIKNYSVTLRKFLEEIGDIPLSSIEDIELNRIFISLVNNSTRSGSLSPTTMNRIKSAYRSFFSWCFQTGRTSKNFGLDLPLSRAQSKPTPPITQEEIVRLITKIRESRNKHKARDHALFAFYIFTGARRLEALHVRMKDYFPANNIVDLAFTKGGKPRSVLIPQFLGDIINDYIAQTITSRSVTPDSFLFPGQKYAQPITGRQIHYRFNFWKKTAGLRDELTIQSLRAGFATITFKYTGDYRLVSKLLGHTESRVSNKYIYFDASEMLHIIERSFQEIFSDLERSITISF